MENGFSLTELLAVIAILALALGISALYLAPLEAPLRAGSSLLESFFRHSRLNAIASTSAYRVRPDGPDRVIAEHAGSCADTTWTADGTDFEFPTGVAMTSQNWFVCFSSRGISSDNVVVTLDHAQYDPINIEVLIGGTTRVHE